MTHYTFRPVPAIGTKPAAIGDADLLNQALAEVRIRLTAQGRSLTRGDLYGRRGGTGAAENDDRCRDHGGPVAHVEHRHGLRDHAAHRGSYDRRDDLLAGRRSPIDAVGSDEHVLDERLVAGRRLDGVTYDVEVALKVSADRRASLAYDAQALFEQRWADQEGVSIPKRELRACAFEEVDRECVELEKYIRGLADSFLGFLGSPSAIICPLLFWPFSCFRFCLPHVSVDPSMFHRLFPWVSNIKASPTSCGSGVLLILNVHLTSFANLKYQIYVRKVSKRT